MWTIFQLECHGAPYWRFLAFAVMQPFLDISMILSCGFFLGSWGEFFPHIYDMEQYVHSREALERLLESLLEALFQSVVFYIGGSSVLGVSGGWGVGFGGTWRSWALLGLGANWPRVAWCRVSRTGGS